MSYSIRINGRLLYSADAAAVDRRFALSSAELKEEENKIPSLVFNLPVFHAYRNALAPLGDTVELIDGSETLFAGRILSVKDDYWKNADVKCEGELGYLQDLPDEYTGAATKENPVSVQTLFSALLAGYAAKADDGRKIYAGVCDVIGSVTKAGAGQCWDTIQEWVKEFGGYLFIRHADSKTYLDYKKDRPPTDMSQAIRFGTNLLETLDRMTDATKIETGVLAIGGKPEGSSTEVTLDGYSAADVENGVLFASSRTYYGTKYKKVSFSECLTQAALYTAAGTYLNGVAAAAVSLKLGAIENKLLGLAPQHMKISTPYNVISAPHGLNAAFPLTKRKLDILSPESSTTEYGVSETALTEKHASWSRTAKNAEVTAAAAQETASSAQTAAAAAQATADAAVPKTTEVNGHALNGNVNLSNSDLGTAVYVTEAGTSGDWTYRIWSDGTKECWCVKEVTIANGGMSAWGSVYIKGFTKSYPANFFSAVPMLSVTPSGGNSGCWCGMASPSNNSKTTAAFTIFRAVNTTAEVTVRVTLHAQRKE